MEYMECEKDFGFAVNFVKSSKSETQHDIQKIYSHVIETPPSKSETRHDIQKIYSHIIETPPSKSKTQHGVHKMWKRFRVCGKLCEVKQVEDPAWSTRNVRVH